MRSLKLRLLNSIRRCNTVRTLKQIHAQLIYSSLLHDEFLISKVAELFGKHVGFVEYAFNFVNQTGLDVGTLPSNTLIAAYASSVTPKAAFLIYGRMVRIGFVPDMYTFPVVMKACTKFLGIREGEQVHALAVKMGFSFDLYVQNSLLHFYSVCARWCDAGRVFDEMLVRDVVSWTGLISGYVRTGLFDEAITLFIKMDEVPNAATFVSVFVACGRMGYLSIGKGVHGLVYKRAFGIGLVVGNALMDMYVKCEYLCEARKLFYELPERDIVSWTTIISGLVQCKRPKDSLELFYNMQVAGVKPDRIILTSILSACASLGALDYGQWVQEYIERQGIEWDIHIGTALVDMYAKCGCIDMALHIFDGMPHRNIFTWNALLGGLAMHGHGQDVLKHFELMTRAGVRPNEVTFLAILTACSHSGLVVEGRGYFYQMVSEPFNFSPRLEHYGCMVDMLCRAGLLDEAHEFIRTMPLQPDVLIWGALLSACKAYGNIELSEEILNHFLELESQDSGVYVLLSNIYAANESWDDVKRVRRLMKDRDIRKFPGSSVIEVDGKAHEFLVGDASHPRNEDIHVLLNILSIQIYLEGCFSIC